MRRLRFVPMLISAVALHSAALAAQQAPIPKPFASINCAYNWCVDIPRTSPNGKFVAHGGGTSLRLVDVASRKSWTLAEGDAYEISWSPRGDMLAYVRDAADGNNTHIWAIPVDASTGKARGPAQRVTVGFGEFPSISPDGRWIAFSAVDSGRSTRGTHLSIVPATGGPARVIAAGRGTSEAFWSADGNSVYADYWERASNSGGVFKYHVDGRTPEVIRSGLGAIAGMTANRQYLVLVPGGKPRIVAGEQGTVIDTTGREVGHFPLPIGERRIDGVIGDSALVWLTVTDRKVLEVKPVAGGTAKRLPLIGESNDAPLWSPDGRRIAFQVRDASRRTVLAISSPDGSNVRIFRETDLIPYGQGISWFPSVGLSFGWSPDSRSVAFVRPDHRQLAVIDLSTGAQRTVLKDTTSTLEGWQWRADGQAFHVNIRGTDSIVYIEEVTLNGQRRKLVKYLDLPRSYAAAWFGGSGLFLRSDSVAFIRSFDNGAMRRLASVPIGTRVPLFAAVSADLRWIAGQLIDPKRRGVSQIELLSTETGVRTVLDVPFTLPSPESYRLVILPNDSSVLAFGQSNGNANLTLYRVPFNGSTPRAFADVGGKPRWRGVLQSASASPDGRSVVYSVQAEPSTQTLGVIDLRGAVPGTRSRALRQ